MPDFLEYGDRTQSCPHIPAFNPDTPHHAFFLFYFPEIR
jgi:hypothetical protein